MLLQPVIGVLDQAVKADNVFVLSTGGDVADAGTLNVVVTAPSSLNVGSRLTAYVRVSCETGGFVADTLIGVTSTGGSAATTAKPLNGNGAELSVASATGQTISSSTTLFTEQAGPGPLELPPVQLAAGAKTAWRLTNSSGATARGSVRVLLVVS